MSFSQQKVLDAVLAQLQAPTATPTVRGQQPISNGFDRGSVQTALEEGIQVRGRQNFRGFTQNIFIGGLQDDFVNGEGRNNLMFGHDGNDTLIGHVANDVLLGGNGDDILFGITGQDALVGDAGNDQILGGIGDNLLVGGTGNDTLVGGLGNNTLIGGDGIDTMTGGTGVSQFVYEGNVFANGVPALAGQTGIKVLNRPDIIKDFTVAEDKFAFDQQDLGIKDLTFQKGNAAEIAGNGDVIVLTNPFPAAGAAARAIANNDNITAKEGVFVYFNSTLGLTRLAYSQDLANGGDVSVLANLDNQRGATGLANVANFSAADFSLV
jgi:serralysin